MSPCFLHQFIPSLLASSTEMALVALNTFSPVTTAAHWSRYVSLTEHCVPPFCLQTCRAIFDACRSLFIPETALTPVPPTARSTTMAPHRDAHSGVEGGLGCALFSVMPGTGTHVSQPMPRCTTDPEGQAFRVVDKNHSDTRKSDLAMLHRRFLISCMDHFFCSAWGVLFIVSTTGLTFLAVSAA